MDRVVDRCAGIDVHKRSVVVCRLTRDAQGMRLAETQTFGTTTSDLLRLADWLAAGDCTPVGLGSTGAFWKPVFNLLEGAFAVWLLNAQQRKAVPGRKTDGNDAQWIAALLAHGLVRPSVIPPQAQRELRDLTRYRTTCVRERGNRVNRVHKLLEGANRTLASVASDIMGLAGRAILAALLAGETHPALLAELAKGPLRTQRPHLEQALRGHLRPHPRFVLTELRAQIDCLDERSARLTGQMQAAGATNPGEPAEVVALRDRLPRLSQATAQVIVAELGTDRCRFPSAAAHTKHTALAARSRRIAARRGHKKALVALAHALLVILYHVMARRQPYHELGEDSFQRLDPAAQAKRLLHQLTHLGFDVQIQPAHPTLLPTGAAASLAGSS